MSESDITLTADEWTVHAREKVSTGDYENGEYHTTISGHIGTGGDGQDGVSLDEDARVELKARLLAVEKRAVETVERAAENRLALPQDRDWGVTHDE